MQSETEKYPEIDLLLQEVGHAFQVQFIKQKGQRPSGKTKVAGQVYRLLSVCSGDLSRTELQEALGLKHRDSFVKDERY